MQGLHDRLVAQAISSDEHVIAAGPLSQQEGSMACRVVLVQSENEFIVFTQEFEKMPDPGVFVVQSSNKTHFHNGNYFKRHQLVAAIEKFADRVKKSAEGYESLYREQQNDADPLPHEHFSHRYSVSSCPHCESKRYLTLNDAIIILSSSAGDHPHNRTFSKLDSTGLLIDVDGLIASGKHCDTLCSWCDKSIKDYEIV